MGRGVWAACLLILAFVATPTFSLHAADIGLADLELIQPSDMRAAFLRARTDRRTGDTTMAAQLTNLTASTITGPVYLVITRIDSPSVVMKGADGVTREGSPYYLIPGPCGPGQTVSKDVVFAPTSGTRLLRFNVYPDLYRLAPANQRPVAQAGPDQQARVGTPTALDGTDSYDPDGDPITLTWSLLETPSGSTAVLDDNTLPNPRFTPDLPGAYRFSLTVADGFLFSQPDETVVTAAPTMAAPNANAGRDQWVSLGETVQLDGAGSREPNDLPLTFAWTFSAIPSGSLLTTSDIVSATSAQAHFVPDVTGLYGLALTVGNGLLNAGDGMLVDVRQANVPPTAVAGPDTAVKLGDAATLDGSASRDPDHAPAALTHRWRLVARPSASAIGSQDIVDADRAVARVTPDVEGIYVARIEVDDGQSQDGDNTAVIADDTPPTVTISYPGEGAVLASRRPTITVAFSDDGAGVDKDSFQLLVNGADVTSAASVNEGSAGYTPVVDLPGGANEVTARVADRTGNLGQASHRFSITVFRAIADCGPTLGTAPHTVTYRSRGQFTGGSIVRYRWDRDGNGTYDTSDSVPADYTWIFNSPGTYNAVLEVQNNLGAVATERCAVTVQRQGPTASASATPSNGPVPLAVTLTCAGQSQNGSITRWEWDYEGDGVYDYTSTTSGTVSHTYATVGDFSARCRVTDTAGLIGVSGVINTTVRPRPQGSPTVTATASRISGIAPVAVTLGGTVVGGGPIRLYEWDFEGDGIVDYSSPTTATVSRTYQAGGVFGPTLRVTDDVGQTSADSIAIEVDVTAGLSIPTDTFLPDSGGTATVRTTLSGTVPVRIVIRDGAGTTVRSLINGSRVAGTYNDSWDGRNDSGTLLPDGNYYAVLQYDIGATTKQVDLTATTGGTRYNPTRNNVGGTFSPFANDPLDIVFTVPSSQGASEILAFVGLYNTDTRLVTLLDRKPFGVGTHTIYWDGLLPNGSRAVAPPGDSFLFGIWGYRLPDNAIYLASAPIISSFSVQPTRYSPARDGSRPLQVRFDLSKAADLDLSVTNLATGGVVFNGRFRGFTAGAGKVLSWDGRNSSGLLPDKGEYRLALTAIDGSGSTSLTRYLLIRVFY